MYFLISKMFERSSSLCVRHMCVCACSHECVCACPCNSLHSWPICTSVSCHTTFLTSLQSTHENSANVSIHRNIPTYEVVTLQRIWHNQNFPQLGTEYTCYRICIGGGERSVHDFGGENWGKKPLGRSRRRWEDNINPLTPNDLYISRTTPLTSKRWILYIYSTNIGTEYFKHALYSPFFPLFKMQFVS